MQDFFFVGIISAIALGVLLFKSILFMIHVINSKSDDEIIAKNAARNELANHQVQQIQKTMNSIENVVEWRTADDPRLVGHDLRHQFLTKTKTRRTPTSSERAASPREKVPLATTDFGADSDDNDIESNLLNTVPIYTYNPSIGGTQV